MKYQHYLAVLLTGAFVTGALVACGGGSGSSSSAGNPTNGTTGTATVAQGTVSGFGSVIVNGVHYDVKDAAIDIDGTPATELDLEAGQQVHVVGTVDADGIHGKATKLEAESQLIGAITAIDLTAGTITLLDQTILVTADTFFKAGLTLATLNVGNIVGVSGFINDQGQIIATHIGIKIGIPANDMQLTGVVANLDTTAMTFTINGKTVNYSAAILTDLPNGTLANGQRVRIHGNVTNNVFVAAGNIRLSSMDIDHDKDITHDLALEVEGVVTNLVANTSFTLGDLTVLIDANTLYKEGVAADLIEGAHVKVHGSLNADRKLVATSVKFHVEAQIEEEGLVTAIDITNSTFTVNGILFEVNTDTSVKDEGESKIHLFSLSSLVVGDRVHVRGYKVLGSSTTADRFVATQVKRQSSNDHSPLLIEVTGVVEAVSGNTITILNHQVELNANTTLVGFANLDAFLAAAVGTKIEVNAFLDGGRLLASKVSLETAEHTEHSSMSSSSSSSSSSAHSDSSASSSSSSSVI